MLDWINDSYELSLIEPITIFPRQINREQLLNLLTLIHLLKGIAWLRANTKEMSSNKMIWTLNLEKLSKVETYKYR